MNYPAMKRVEQFGGLHSNFLAIFRSNMQHLTASIDSDNPTTHWHAAIFAKKGSSIKGGKISSQKFLLRKDFPLLLPPLDGSSIQN